MKRGSQKAESSDVTESVTTGKARDITANKAAKRVGGRPAKDRKPRDDSSHGFEIGRASTITAKKVGIGENTGETAKRKPGKTG